MDRDGTAGQVPVAAGALAPIVAAILLIAVRGVIDSTNIALALVVVVVTAGALGGRVAGACAAVTAALSFNFFHTRPYLSLRIASADDAETMALLLLIGLIVGQVAAVARRREGDVQRGREEVERVWRVVEKAVSGAEVDDVITTARGELVGLLHLHDCWWFAGHDGSTMPVLQPSGVFEGTRVHRLAGGDFELPLGGFDIPVRAEGKVLGHFRCVPIAGVGVGLGRRRTAVVLADAVGLASRGARSLHGPSRPDAIPPPGA